MEPMRLVVQNAEDGYLRMFRRMTRPGWRIAYASVLIGVGVGFVAFLGEVDLTKGATLILCSILAAFIAYWIRFNRNLKSAIKANAWMVADFELEISERGVGRKLPFQESHFEWPFFKSVREAPEGIALVTGGSSFLFIPRSALEGNEDGVRAFIEPHHPIKPLH